MPVSPVLHRTRVPSAAWRSAEASCGSTGRSGGTPRRPGPRVLFVRRLPESLLLGALALGALGCGVAGDAADVVDEADRTLRFDHSAPSLDVLGRRVLDGLARRDRAALEALRLTEYEHNAVVWPELPASAPDVNFPIDYAWSNIQNRNVRGLARLLPAFEHRRTAFRSVECRGATERFTTFEVRTDCWIVFTLEGGPEVWEIQAFRDAIVRGGGAKIFRYYDEGPRPWRGRVPG